MADSVVAAAARRWLSSFAFVGAAFAVLFLTIVSVAGTESKEASGIGTGAAKLENGDVVCMVEGKAMTCVSRDLPAGLRRSLAAMLTRGFELPPKPPCPAPICPQPICYESTAPKDWLTLPNAPSIPGPKAPR